MRNYPEFFGVKLPADLAADLRRAAREDDRTISGFLRRLLAAVLRPASPDSTPNANERDDR